MPSHSHNLGNAMLSPSCIQCQGSKQALVQTASPVEIAVEGRQFGPLVCDPQQVVEFDQLLTMLHNRYEQNTFEIKEIWCSECGVQYSATALNFKFN